MDDNLAVIEKKINKSPEITLEDMKTIHDMIKVYRGIISLGSAAKFIVFILATIAAGVTAWATILERIKEAL